MRIFNIKNKNKTPVEETEYLREKIKEEENNTPIFERAHESLSYMQSFAIYRQ
jgi:hypothetical protein